MNTLHEEITRKQTVQVNDLLKVIEDVPWGLPHEPLPVLLDRHDLDDGRVHSRKDAVMAVFLDEEDGETERLEDLVDIKIKKPQVV